MADQERWMLPEESKRFCRMSTPSEQLRRRLLDLLGTWGYEQVMRRSSNISMLCSPEPGAISICRRSSSPTS